MPKLQKRILITLVILIIVGWLQLDTVFIGENFIGTAFFVLLGLGLMFNSMEEKDTEIKTLRYHLHQSVFGDSNEKEEASHYAVSNKLLLDNAKQDLEKQYGNNN